MSSNELYDVIIIGGGPTGLFAAYYAALRRMKVAVIESLNELGGQPTLLYPEKEIKDLPGFLNITGNDFIKQLLQQLEKQPIDYFLNQQVIEIEKKNDLLFKVKTQNNSYQTKTVILATGGGSFEPRRLPFPEVKELENVKIFYSLNHLSLFQNKKVAVLGGGDSAVDGALLLEKVAKKVHLIHRRETFRALESSLEELNQSTIQVETPYVLNEIKETIGSLQLALRHVKKKEISLEEFDCLYVAYGFVNRHQAFFIKDLQYEKGKILIDSRCQTNIPGIFACGDITTYEGKVEIIVTGLGEAPTAVNNAFHKIAPLDRFQPPHSTSL